MGKLYLECLQKKIKNKKAIADAVYTVLNQTDKLKAEIVFSDDDDMRTLNFDTRGVDSVTDVLSYPTLDGVRGAILRREDHLTELDGNYLFIGSIVLCEGRIKSQAAELGHSLERETTYLIVHGLMHLFGYDHMKRNDKKEMREKEKAALALLGIEE
ncbi:MAG: rRNA maturation RNase YbeY [Clostridia bacterium]|nr:rRNA maturation RNase YbeY [Clostridia bacterium]